MARRSKTETEIPDDEEMPLNDVDNLEDVVSNASEVPLFAGAGFANNRSIAKLKLIKLDNPGAGYKGEIPLTSTLETIGQLHGDGLYNIEAVNGKGRQLRVLENQRIALGFSPHDTPRTGAPASTTVLGTSTADLDRVERLARQSANESVAQAQSFRDMVVATTTASAAREREFMQGVQTQSQTFMASLMAAQAQGFTQLMTLLQTGHQQMMEAAGAMRPRTEDSGDSAERLMSIFMQGMNLGRGMDGQEQEPFWQEILRGGASLLTNTRQAQLAAMNPQPAPRGAKRASGNSKLARILKAMRARGIDADQLLHMLEGGGERPESDEPEDEPESEAGIDEQNVRPEGPFFTGTGDS